MSCSRCRSKREEKKQKEKLKEKWMADQKKVSESAACISDLTYHNSMMEACLTEIASHSVCTLTTEYFEALTAEIRKVNDDMATEIAKASSDVNAESSSIRQQIISLTTKINSLQQAIDRCKCNYD